MDYTNIFEKIDRNLNHLCPMLCPMIAAALAECHDAGYSVEVFEGWRSPFRQALLYKQNTPEKFVTGALPWNSFHQFGLAIDIAYLINGKWDWSGDFDKPAAIFKSHGFETISKEVGHFQITAGLKLSEIQKIAREQGIPAVWAVVEAYL